MSEQTLSETSSGSNKSTRKRKIELCRSFVENGYCWYGNMCFFAHGIDDLHISQPILKTKLCRNFQKFHCCKYGDRCNFRHEAQPCTNPFLSAFLQYPEIISVTNFRKRINQNSCSDVDV